MPHMKRLKIINPKYRPLGKMFLTDYIFKSKSYLKWGKACLMEMDEFVQ